MEYLVFFEGGSEMRDLRRLICPALSDAVSARPSAAASARFGRFANGASSRLFYVRFLLFISVLSSSAAGLCRAAGFETVLEGE